MDVCPPSPTKAPAPVPPVAMNISSQVVPPPQATIPARKASPMEVCPPIAAKAPAPVSPPELKEPAVVPPPAAMTRPAEDDRVVLLQRQLDDTQMMLRMLLAKFGSSEDPSLALAKAAATPVAAGAPDPKATSQVTMPTPTGVSANRGPPPATDAQAASAVNLGAAAPDHKAAPPAPEALDPKASAPAPDAPQAKATAPAPGEPDPKATSPVTMPTPTGVSANPEVTSQGTPAPNPKAPVRLLGSREALS